MPACSAAASTNGLKRRARLRVPRLAGQVELRARGRLRRSRARRRTRARTRWRVDRHERGGRIGARARQHLGDRLLGVGLRLRVEGGLDAQAALEERAPAAPSGGPPNARSVSTNRLHPLDEVTGGIAVVAGSGDEHERLAPAPPRPRPRARGRACRSDRGRTCGGPAPRRVLVRVVALRRLEQAGEQGRLGQVEVLRVAGEVEVGGGLDAVRAVPEVDRVQVPLEDLALASTCARAGSPAPPRAACATPSSCWSEHHVRTYCWVMVEPPRPGSPAGVADERPDHRPGVDALVVEEAGVLRRRRPPSAAGRRDLRQRDRVAVLVGVEGGEDGAVGREHRLDAAWLTRTARFVV